jgi:RNA polymerase sigma-70 factor, ECF subfamily
LIGWRIGLIPQQHWPQRRSAGSDARKKVRMGDGFLDDEMLIARAQSGDRTAINSLVRKHEEAAYRYAYRLTRDPEVAADVVAEAFVRVYNAIQGFRGQSSFTTWLYRILTNCFLDLRKRDRHRDNLSLDESLRLEDSDVVPQLEDKGGTPQELLERVERERRVERALKSLPEYQRAMIVMFHAEGLSYEGIAEALDLPVGTVKSRLNRARIALRELLVRDEELFRL